MGHRNMAVMLPQAHNEHVGSNNNNNNTTGNGNAPVSRTMMKLLMLSLALAWRYRVTLVSGDTAATTATASGQMLAGRNLRRSGRLQSRQNENDDNYDYDDDYYIWPSVGKISALRLVDSNTDGIIRTINNVSLFNLYRLPTLNLNIKIDTNGTVGSINIVYSYTNTTSLESPTTFSRIDFTRPYSLCGDTNTTIITPSTPSNSTSSSPNLTTNIVDYDACSMLRTAGRHTLTVTPYEYANATGPRGQPYTVTFQLINEKPRYFDYCTVPRFYDASWSSFNKTNPVKVLEPQGTLVNTNDLVIFAGFRSGFSEVTNRTYARDVRYLNSTWRRMDDMPLASGITHMAIVNVGSIVYLCGGYHGPHPGPHTSICFQYNHSIAPGAGAQWSYLPSLPNGGSAGGGMVYSTAYNTLYYTGGGQRLVPGGVQPVDVNNTWKLALHNQSAGWLPSTPLPYLANHLSYVTHRDTLGYERHYMLAGQVSENECCGNLAYNYEFLPHNETWIQRASIPIPRGHAASSTRAFGCGFIIAGGSINNPNRTSTTKIRTDDISYYDVNKDTWATAIGKLPAIGATPIVDIHNNGYMHFISPLPLSERRRITVEYQ